MLLLTGAIGATIIANISLTMPAFTLNASHLLFLPIHFRSKMPRFLLAALLLLATTTTAFTPDAAFKRAQIQLTAGNLDKPKNVYVYTQNKNNRNLLSTVNNLRKSVTQPPSFEEYMATRRRHLLQGQEENAGNADASQQQVVDNNDKR